MNEAAAWLFMQRERRREKHRYVRLLAAEVFLFLIYAIVRSTFQP